MSSVDDLIHAERPRGVASPIPLGIFLTAVMIGLVAASCSSNSSTQTDRTTSAPFDPMEIMSGDGYYQVGDTQYWGSWQSDGATGDCNWSIRLVSPDAPAEILSEGSAEPGERPRVDIEPLSGQGWGDTLTFQTRGCGSWHLVKSTSPPTSSITSTPTSSITSTPTSSITSSEPYDGSAYAQQVEDAILWNFDLPSLADACPQPDWVCAIAAIESPQPRGIKVTLRSSSGCEWSGRLRRNIINFTRASRVTPPATVMVYTAYGTPC